MNELTIFQREEWTDLKLIDQKNKEKYTGFFYILEWDHRVKIGCTKAPYSRLMSLKRTAEKYGDSQLGRFALSVPHTNYRENEKILHRHFSDKQEKGSELFSIQFEDTLGAMPTVIYMDNSKKREEKAEQFFQAMKKFTLGG